MRAALFDLDGVILDTESQYSCFWGEMGRLFHPEVPDFSSRIKGQTLTEIYDRWFADDLSLQEDITRRLDAFEDQMQYNYIKGSRAYVESLRRRGVHTAIVTSSNQAKMSNVHRAHPELSQLFEHVLTSENFAASKPAPDGYLMGAKVFGLEPSECVVFEDSINGLRAGRAAGCFVVGLATTLDAATIAPLCDLCVNDFNSPALP